MWPAPGRGEKSEKSTRMINSEDVFRVLRSGALLPGGGATLRETRKGRIAEGNLTPSLDLGTRQGAGSGKITSLETLVVIQGCRVKVGRNPLLGSVFRRPKLEGKQLSRTGG